MMKKKVRDLIKILGIGANELILDIDLGDTVFNSIELNEELDLIILHKFEEEDLDYEYNFEDLDEEKQLIIYKNLSIIYN